MPLDEIRSAAIEALFEADLMQFEFVLKGGNALGLLRIGDRSSLDVDLSIPTDVANLAQLAAQVEASLSRSYLKLGYRVFDLKVSQRPSDGPGTTPDWWGGYEIVFKIEPRASDYRSLEQRRRAATVVGPMQQRKLRIQISKHEFCGKVEQVTLEEATIRVYAPSMIAAEKLRAICQQMPEYPYKSTKTPRARDFYDIQTICTAGSIDMTTPENLELIRDCFAAKRVDPSLMKRISLHREFHRPDWAAVEASVAAPLMDFDSYFNFVRDLALGVGNRLE